MQIAQSDGHAFELMEGRFTGEVGTILDFCIQEFDNPTKEYFKPKDSKGNGKGFPLWSLTRMMMPVAESLGDLLYKDRPEKNLIKIFKNEFTKQNPNYGKMPYIIANLYRHSLTHHDEPHSLILDSHHNISWVFHSGSQFYHLDYIKDNKTGMAVIFNLESFYTDILNVIKDLRIRAVNNEWNGSVKDNYNSWTEKYIRGRSDLERELEKEINNFPENS